MLRLICTLLIAAFSGCLRSVPAPDPIPAHEAFTLSSKVLGESRPIFVALPPGTDGTQAFDVVYMPDGGLDEDFPHIAHTLHELMRRGVIAPVILVGIKNTVRRRDLTGPTSVASDREVAPVVGGSEAFRRFLEEELFPAIEARYRVTARRTIVGESLAALFVIETLFREPQLFDGYIAISPSLWWNDHELVRQARARFASWGQREAALYLTTANETDIAPHTDALAAILAEVAPPGLRWTYEPRKDLEHHTIFRATKEAGFRAVLPAPRR